MSNNPDNELPKDIQEIIIDIQEAITELDRIEQSRIDAIENIKKTTLVKALNLAKKYSQQHDEPRRLIAIGIYKDIEKFLKATYDR